MSEGTHKHEPVFSLLGTSPVERWIALLLLGVFAAVGIALLRPALTDDGSSGRKVATENSMKTLMLALLTYADESPDNSFPSTIAELPESALSAADRHFHDHDSGRVCDWLYFQPSAKIDWKYAPGTVVVGSPTTLSEKWAAPGEGEKLYRAVAFLDGHVDLIEESEYREVVRQQSGAINSDPAGASSE